MYKGFGAASESEICVMIFLLTVFFVAMCTYQDNFADNKASWWIDNPVNRLVAGKREYNRLAWLAITDNSDGNVTGGWRASVDDLVHR